MRFTIEERHLTDVEGRPVSALNAVEFHTLEAGNIDDAVRLYVKDAEEILGDVLKFPGFQAVATVRKRGGVYTLQFTPASQEFGSSDVPR